MFVMYMKLGTSIVTLFRVCHIYCKMFFFSIKGVNLRFSMNKYITTFLDMASWPQFEIERVSSTIPNTPIVMLGSYI